jgi:hypothetical protein
MHINNILVTEWLDFRKGISTENVTFKLTDKVLKAINHKIHVGGIVCDVAKACNCKSWNLVS